MPGGNAMVGPAGKCADPGYKSCNRVFGVVELSPYARQVLLELDAGERDDETEELWALFDLLNVACGGHAGDDASMARLAAFCAARTRPELGAHPSYADREGFGRRTIAIAP